MPPDSSMADAACGRFPTITRLSKAQDAQIVQGQTDRQCNYKMGVTAAAPVQNSTAFPSRLFTFDHNRARNSTLTHSSRRDQQSRKQPVQDLNLHLSPSPPPPHIPMPSTPSRRARQSNSQASASTPRGGDGQGQQQQSQRQQSQGQGQVQPVFQTPTNNNNAHNTRLRSATRSAAATASATGSHNPPGNGSGSRSNNTPPNNSFTTPTRHSRQNSGVHNSAGGLNGANDWTIGGSGGSGGGAPGSASSTTSNSTSRRLRGPAFPNPHITLKRSSGSSGSLSGQGNSSFSATLASLSELSPSAGPGSRTPSTPLRKSQTATANQSMRVIPSPFANSPASWLETSFLPSPIKGFALSAGTSSTGAGSSSIGGGLPGTGGPASIFEVISAPSSIGSAIRLPSGGMSGQGVHPGYDSSYLSGVDFFTPAEIHRDRNTVDSMRAWRTDAMHQHMYKTAAYWGDKVLSVTEDSNDVFWLSQVYYLMGEYDRAINLLQKQQLLESSVACRFLAIQCMIRTEKWTEALEYLGEENQFAKDSPFDSNVNNADGGIKLEASMCYLRGIVYKNMNNIDRAKECFKEALQIDVKCYDALDSLISGSMMTTSEERQLMEKLEFDKQLYGPDTSFVKMLYQSKMNKFDHLDEQEDVYKALAAKFQAENADLLYSKAETYFTQCCFDKCLKCTKRILEMDKFNLACVPMHIVSLYELGLKNELFFIAHELVDQHPKHAIAWFAVGVYYYLIGNLAEARRYFGKASTIDPHYGPAWIGFGHSFALEGEHDQAISAYATSSKLFQGSHLGSMYIGMQHLQQNNVLLAQKYLTYCLTICDSDPLLLNEIAAVRYNLEQYDEAVKLLHRVTEKLQRSQRKNVIWETTWLNLAHSYRKLGKYSEAETYFLKVDGITSAGPTKAAALVGLGFIYQIMDQISDAVECYHKVLAIRPSDQVASEMLRKIMEDKVRVAETEWMLEYLPEELRDDEEVERRVRSMEERKAKTAGIIAATQSEASISVVVKGKRKGSMGVEETSSNGSSSRIKSEREPVVEMEEEETDDMELEET